MFRRVDVLAAAAGLSILAACSSATTPSMTSAGTPAVTPDKNCRGSGGVEVAPCPIRLTKHTKSGIVVTVSGRGVVGSYLGELNGCFNGKLCYNAEREGSSEVEWRITSGQSCGNADVEFDGVNASGQKVGYFFLKLSNKYCP